jgi:hypothetical protein
VPLELHSGTPTVVMQSSEPIGPVVLPADNPTRLKVTAVVEQKPETAARLVRAWLKNS